MNRLRSAVLVAAILSLASLVATTAAAQSAAPDLAARLERFRQRVNHIIVIYQENWSFDGMYGKFPGADGLANAGAAATQVDKHGVPYKTLPRPMGRILKGPKGTVDGRFPDDLPNAPFDLARFIKPEDRTGDMIHAFYHEQLQIDGGKMDRFVAWTDAGGLPMSYYDVTDLPEGKLAQRFTLCDHFFHAAFGGSYLNHIWLIAAATPTFPGAPAEIRCDPDPEHLKDLQVTQDGYAVNTIFSVNLPHRRGVHGNDVFARHPDRLLPSQTLPTIGDRLSDRKISWAWYAGGWDRAMAEDPDPEFNRLFQFHHQPFVYFANFADGTDAKKEHLKDEKDFLAAVADSALPSVAFVKPYGDDDEHPGYASLGRGQNHVGQLLRAIEQSKYWNDSVVIITYDEHGGRWDHVAPPKKDRWGPGSRVPTIVISPFASRGYIDHTEYDTTSILKLIEERWQLKPLSSRDRDAGDLLNALGGL